MYNDVGLLMKHSIKIIICTVLIAIAAIGIKYAIKQYSMPKTEATEYVAPDLDSEKLWELVQKWRASQNKPEYQKNDSLCKISDERSKEMYTIDHSLFLERYSNSYPSVLSENLANPFRTEQGVLNGWLNSKDHREILSRNYKYSCVSTNGSLAVQIFSNCEYGCPSP